MNRLVAFISTPSTSMARERARTSSTSRRTSFTWSATCSSLRWCTFSTRRKERATNRSVTMRWFRDECDEREEALNWLASPDLLERLANDLGRLASWGRDQSDVCYSPRCRASASVPSGAGAVLLRGGKSTLVEAATALVPPEDLVSLSSITSQALYYLAQRDCATRCSSCRRTRLVRAAYASNCS